MFVRKEEEFDKYSLESLGDQDIMEVNESLEISTMLNQSEYFAQYRN
jgi:hypothetical protein